MMVFKILQLIACLPLSWSGLHWRWFSSRFPPLLPTPPSFPGLPAPAFVSCVSPFRACLQWRQQSRLFLLITFTAWTHIWCVSSDNNNRDYSRWSRLQREHVFAVFPLMKTIVIIPSDRVYKVNTYDIMKNPVPFAIHEGSKLKFFCCQIWLFLVINQVTTTDLVKKLCEFVLQKKKKLWMIM